MHPLRGEDGVEIALNRTVLYLFVVSSAHRAVYKWMVVVCVTIFTVYFFEAREHDLLAWAMSFR